MVKFMDECLQALMLCGRATAYGFRYAYSMCGVIAVPERVAFVYGLNMHDLPPVRGEHERTRYVGYHRKIRLLVTSNDPSLSNSISAYP